MTPVMLLSLPPASSTMDHRAANHAKTPFVSVFAELKHETDSTNIGSAVEYRKNARSGGN